MICKNCGTFLKDGAKFCGSCGTPVAVVEAPAPVVEAPAPVVEAPAPVVEAPAPVVEAPTPVVEAPAPVVEAPAPVVEAPAPVVEAPAPVVEAPAPVYVAPAPVVVDVPVPTPVAPAPTYVPTAPSRSIKKVMTEQDLPEEYRPMGAWSYVGLQLLFAVPIVGLVFLIIFTFKRSNLNRRAFARSYWCWLALVGIVLTTALVLMFISGSSIDRML